MLTDMASQKGFSGSQFEPGVGQTFFAGSGSFAHAIERIGTARRFRRNAKIYSEDEPAEYIYKVVSGTVRTYKLAVDGRRHIGAFYLPGDIFGSEAQEQHLFSAESVVDGEVLVVKRKLVMSLAARHNDVAAELWRLTSRELQRTRNHMLLLSKSASERVASFLLEMAERAPSDEIRLSMSRQDVADYLGLTNETVSRMLTRFESSSTIELPGCKRIVLRNRPVLKRLLA